MTLTPCWRAALTLPGPGEMICELMEGAVVAVAFKTNRQGKIGAASKRAAKPRDGKLNVKAAHTAIAKRYPKVLAKLAE